MTLVWRGVRIRVGAGYVLRMSAARGPIEFTAVNDNRRRMRGL